MLLEQHEVKVDMIDTNANTVFHIIAKLQKSSTGSLMMGSLFRHMNNNRIYQNNPVKIYKLLSRENIYGHTALDIARKLGKYGIESILRELLTQTIAAPSQCSVIDANTQEGNYVEQSLITEILAILSGCSTR